MLKLTLGLMLAVAGLLRLLRLHLGIANDAGSPKVEEPFEIKEPEVAKAIYGRLEPGKEVEHYAFFAEQEAKVRAMLLITTTAYSKGLRANIRLQGPGLPAEGVTLEPSEYPLHIAGRDYMLVQRYLSPLPQTGHYQVAVQREAGAGTYCFCVGDGDGGYSDEAMRQRIDALLAQDE